MQLEAFCDYKNQTEMTWTSWIRTEEIVRLTLADGLQHSQSRCFKDLVYTQVFPYDKFQETPLSTA